MPNYLNRVVYLSETQKNELFTTGTTSGNGEIISYDDNDLYVVAEDSSGGGNIDIATYSEAGIVQPWYSHTAASTGPTAGSDATAVTVNSISTTAGKYYAVEADSAGKMFVNVPWTGGGSTSYTSFSGKPTANQTPAFGGTFTISQIAQDSTGQVSGTDRTITIPSTTVSSTSSGLAPKGASVSTQSQTTKFLREDGSWTAPSYTTNTDRYVNSAAFADDSTNNSSSPVKLTLTRAGSDTSTVTANIPKVSSSGAGVVPKGTAVSTQSQSTKFLREDGTWAAPSYSARGTDENVKQEKTLSSDSNTYELLFASTNTDATVTSYAKKYYGLSFTPSTGVLSAGKFNGLTLTAASTGFTIAGGTTSKTLTVGSDYTLAAACAKSVDSSISASSTSTNLPTSAAVASFVEGKGYKTTDANVTQTATTTSAAYEILFSGTADNTTRTEGARKTNTLTYNPSTKALATGGSVNGLTLTAATTGFTIAGGTTSKTLTVSETYTLAAACAKSVDSSVSSSSTNLPTSSAVYSYVTGAIPSFTAITSAEIDAIVV